MDNYEGTTRLGDMIENNFSYHAPKDDQQERYIFLRELAKRLAYGIAKNTPANREQALAITNLEQAVFWANASIARGE